MKNNLNEDKSLVVRLEFYDMKINLNWIIIIN